jgi:integrase
MASVEKRLRNGKVTWLARWRDPDGRQRKKSFRRRVDADRFLAGVNAELLRGTYIDPSAGRMTLSEWADRWMSAQGHLKETTSTRYEGLIRVHILPRFGHRRLASVTHSEVAGWVAELVAAGHAPGSVRQLHRVLSRMFDLAVRDGRIGRNPALRVPLPRPHRGEPRFLTAQEVMSLGEAAGNEGASIRVLALTGLRFGELTALRVKRVDLSRRRLVVAESATEVGGRLVWSTPKSHQSRTVPLPLVLTPDLAPLLAGRSGDELVFTSPQGGPLRLNNWRRRVFNPACESCGMTGLTPHDLRHTAASLAVSAGANIKAVQRMLGHASAAMTLDVYAALFDEDLDAVAVGLDALVPPLCPTRAGGRPLAVGT